MNPGNAVTPRARKLLIVLLALTVFALCLLLFVVRAPSGGLFASPVTLQMADSALQFKQVLLRDWQGGDSEFSRLRDNLFFDSVLFVPGYVGLLLFFTLALGPQEHRALRQLLCVPALAAGLFDIAENGMTGRALDDLVHFVLANETVADVRHASQAKWLLLALALAVLAPLAQRRAAGDTPWRTCAAALSGLAALALMAAVWWPAQALLLPGLLLTGAGLGLLSWRWLRR